MNAPGSCSCGREWMAEREAHCASCHEHFTSDSAFDLHLGSPNGEIDCFHPSTLKAKEDGTPVLVLSQRKSGLAWSKPRSDRLLSHFATPPESIGTPSGLSESRAAS